MKKETLKVALTNRFIPQCFACALFCIAALSVTFSFISYADPSPASATLSTTGYMTWSWSVAAPPPPPPPPPPPVSHWNDGQLRHLC